MFIFFDELYFSKKTKHQKFKIKGRLRGPTSKKKFIIRPRALKFGAQ